MVSSPAAPPPASQLVSCRCEPVLVPGLAALGQKLHSLQDQAPVMHVGALVAMRLGIRSLQCNVTSLEAQATTRNFKEPEAEAS